MGGCKSMCTSGRDMRTTKQKIIMCDAEKLRHLAARGRTMRAGEKKRGKNRAIKSTPGLKNATTLPATSSGRLTGMEQCT
jgi:hypothetical protein